MGLASETSRWAYTGNGSASSFSFSAKIMEDSDLLVTKRLISTGAETTLALTTDYTVAGVGDDAGGSITLVAGALAATYKIVIRRVRPITQETDIRNQTDFYPETHEDEFDMLVMVDQQQQDELDRSVKLPETVTSSDFDPRLPVDITDNPEKVLCINDDGDGFELKEASEVAALAGQTTHSITDGQSATSLTDVTLDSAVYTSAIYDYEIVRGTTVFSTGRFSLHYRDSTWRLVMWSENYDDSASASGVTFSLTGTTVAQIQAACDTGAGNGTIQLKKHRF